MDPKVSNNITPILLLGPDGRAAKKKNFSKNNKKKRNRTKRNNNKIPYWHKTCR